MVNEPTQWRKYTQFFFYISLKKEMKNKTHCSRYPIKSMNWYCCIVNLLQTSRFRCVHEWNVICFFFFCFFHRVCMLCVCGGCEYFFGYSVKRESPWFHVMLITSMIYALNRTLTTKFMINFIVFFCCLLLFDKTFFGHDFAGFFGGFFFILLNQFYILKISIKNLCTTYSLKYFNEHWNH